MTRWNERVVYIDGFAGPGVYEGGEPGSPLIALDAAASHRPPISQEVVFLFVERDAARLANLRTEIERRSWPPNFRIELEEGTCAEVLTSLLDQVESGRTSLAPTFAFFDPFGYSHTPFPLMERILRHPKCELLVTFMYEEVNRFLAHEEQATHFDELFGTREWRAFRSESDPEIRRSGLRELYQTQLRLAGARYVRAFEMLNYGNRTDYFLVYATKDVTGLKKMKEAMWKVDASSGVQFRDTTDQTQLVLFQTVPDSEDLRRRITERFGRSRIRIADLENFIVEDTPYRETHYKSQVLRPLELADPPGVVVHDAPSGRRRGTYPPELVVEFVQGQA